MATVAVAAAATPAEIARECRVTRACVVSWIKQGLHGHLLPATKDASGRWTIDRAEFDAWLAEHAPKKYLPK